MLFNTAFINRTKFPYFLPNISKVNSLGKAMKAMQSELGKTIYFPKY